MNLRKFESTLVLSLGLFVLTTAGHAQGGMGGMGGGMGGGGQAEETASKAELFNDPVLPGVHGDTGGSSSLYRHATLDSGDCALVIATRIDKQSGTAFLWLPNPNVEENCEMNGIPANRTFKIRQLSPPVADFDGDMVAGEVEEEVSFARIELAGLYRPVADVMADGVNVNIAIGPYRIAYPTVYPTAMDFQENGTGTLDVRTVTVSADPAASICAWPTGKTKGKTICEPIDGGIRLPIKVKFTRLPPEP